MRTLTLIAAVMLLWAPGFPGATAADKDELVRLRLHVLADTNKQPVANAHVIVRFVKGKKFFFKDKRASWEAKTNGKGSLVLDGIPPGSVKIQVIAKGYQTYGDEHELSKPEEQLTILLKTPAGQYSAY